MSTPKILKHIQHFRVLLGVAGIDAEESQLAKQTCTWFRRLLIPIGIVLLYQHYLLSHGEITIETLIRHDWVLWFYFVTEEILLLHLVKNKRRFIFQNWLNLFIIVVLFPPILMFDTFLTLPELRLLLVIRLLPPLFDAVINILFHNNITSTLAVTLFATLFWGLLMPSYDTGIKSPIDGIWLAWETVTTVGYGDVVPTTTFGRFLAVILMVAGVALTSLLTANFSTFIMNRSNQNKRNEHLIMDRLKSLEENMIELHDTIKKIEKHLSPPHSNKPS